MIRRFALDQIRSMKVGQHLHLDGCVLDPPSPGDPAWLEIISDLIQRIMAWGGAWTISMAIGTTASIPIFPVDLDGLFALVDKSSLVEPPAVYRLRDALTVNSWEGERHIWQSLLQPSLTQVISLTRSKCEISAGEDLYVRVAFEIRSGRHRVQEE